MSRHTHDEGPLANLGISDHLVERIGRIVHIGKHARVAEALGDLFGIWRKLDRYGDDDDLTRVEPEWPKRGERSVMSNAVMRNQT